MRAWVALRLLLPFLCSWLLNASAYGQAQGSSPSSGTQAEPSATAQRVQAEPSASAHRASSGWTALPVLTYAPETEFGAGGFAAHFFRLGSVPSPEHEMNARPSSIAAVALVTTRRQVVLELLPELYWSNDKFRIWSKLDYRYYPNAYWGIGPKTEASAREWYRENGPRLQFNMRGMVIEQLYFEGKFDAQLAKIENLDPDGQLKRGTIAGAQGKRVVGFGLGLGWDSRDHGFTPHSGSLLEASVWQYHHILRSQFTFTRMVIDLRHYVPVWKAHTLALQFYSEVATGVVPFYRLPMLGGQRTGRGYFEGRYRDRAMVAAQAEYRFPLFWRLGAVGFAGIGEVGGSISDIRFGPVKWSAGGGLRFLLSRAEALNLRADIGFGHDTWGAYVGVAEAF